MTTVRPFHRPGHRTHRPADRHRRRRRRRGPLPARPLPRAGAAGRL